MECRSPKYPMITSCNIRRIMVWETRLHDLVSRDHLTADCIGYDGPLASLVNQSSLLINKNPDEGYL